MEDILSSGWYLVSPYSDLTTSVFRLSVHRLHQPTITVNQLYIYVNQFCPLTFSVNKLSLALHIATVNTFHLVY